MKRAPVIPKHTIKDIRPETEPSAAPAAPMEPWLVEMPYCFQFAAGK